MTMTGLESFDTAVQKADIWLKELMKELNTDSRRRAYMVLRAVLHTLRDRLTIDEAADLGAQLPMLVRGIYYDEWDPSIMPVRDRHLDDFLMHVKGNYRGNDQIDIEQMTRAVFKVLRNRISQGEIKDVKGMMPIELQELWR